MNQGKGNLQEVKFKAKDFKLCSREPKGSTQKIQRVSQLVFKISLKAKMLVLCIITWKSYTKGSYHSNVKQRGKTVSCHMTEDFTDAQTYMCCALHQKLTNVQSYHRKYISLALSLSFFRRGCYAVGAGLRLIIYIIWACLTPLPTVSTSCVLGSQMCNILLS